jgi:predicted nucleic acid-binding protein
MSDIVVDSSVMAKWILPEPDSVQAQRLVSVNTPSGRTGQAVGPRATIRAVRLVKSEAFLPEECAYGAAIGDS